MLNYLKKNEFQKNDLIALLVVIFFSLNYHIYNTVNIFIYIISTIFFSTFLFLKTIQTKIYLNKHFILLVIFFLIFFIFYFKNFLYFSFEEITQTSKISFADNFINYLLTNLSFFFPVFFFSLSFLFIPIFANLSEEKINYFFLIINIICIMLLLISLMRIFLDNNFIGHQHWGRPFLYLFFYNDSIASKLQHANILFFSSLIFFYNFFNKEKINLLLWIIVILNLFFIFVIFSLLFIGVTLITFLLIFLLHKKKILFLNRLLKLSAFVILLIFILFKIIHFKNGLNNSNPPFNKFYPKDIIMLKFSSIIKILDFSENKIIYKDLFKNNKVALILNDTYFKNYTKEEATIKSINQINSNNQRLHKKSKCLDTTKFIQHKTFNKSLKNCESFIVEGIYKFGYIFLFFIIIFYLTFLFLLKNNYLAIIFLLISIIISSFSLIHENSFFYTMLSLFISQQIRKT